MYIYRLNLLHFSSRLSPVLLSKSVSFGTIGEAPANRSGSLSSLVNYNDDTDEVDDLGKSYCFVF